MSGARGQIIAMTMQEKYLLGLLCLFFLVPLRADERPSEATSAATVFGPRNADLYEGAQLLIRGKYEEGIRRTRLGLDIANNDRERQAGLSNLCAGYLRLKEYEVALEYCNQALQINARNWRALSNRALVNIMLEQYTAAERDIDLAEEVAPYARAIKEARAIFLDATQPVSPYIEIDDRRDSADES